MTPEVVTSMSYIVDDAIILDALTAIVVIQGIDESIRYIA